MVFENFPALEALAVGVGATLVMDVWAVFLKRAFNARSVNWGLVGRWLGHIPRGRYTHDNLVDAASIRGERAIGWCAHYLVGIGFAFAFLFITGDAWLQAPTPLPAIIFGLGTVVFPFFIMQPGMGAGIAASKTPNPWQARMRSLVTHLIFGIGLYIAARILMMYR